MKYDRLRGSTSNMVRIFIPDNTSAVGAGLTGLTNASANLTIAYLRELDSVPTIYSGANIEAQTTIGTFQAPSLSSKVRFKEVNSTSFPGMYELQFHDSATIFGTGDASRNVQINIYEATTTALHIGPNPAEIRLISWDMQVALASSTIGTVTNLTNNPSGVTTMLADYARRTGDYATVGAAMTLTAAYDAAKTASQFSAASDRVLLATQQIVFKKNAAFNGFEFVMTDSTTHLPATGLTVTAERALDGAALAACANAVTETTHGGYKINFAAGDLNGNSIRVRFSATGADDLNFTIVTQL